MNMLAADAFYLIAAFTAISAVAVFAQRKLIHSVVALASAFTGSALLFFLIGQTMIALLQLLVFVGGLSTYLIVAIAAEEKNAKTLRVPVLVAAVVLLLGALSLMIGYAQPSSPAGQANFIGSAAIAFGSDYALLYVMGALLFGTVISGVLIIRKFSRLLV